MKLEKKNEWSFHIFKNWNFDELNIHYGDIFWLNQLELNSLFVTSKSIDNTIKIYLKS